jgi:putative nucleotidyltransferase with HDIG domain
LPSIEQDDYYNRSTLKIANNKLFSKGENFFSIAELKGYFDEPTLKTLLVLGGFYPILNIELEDLNLSASETFLHAFSVALAAKSIADEVNIETNSSLILAGFLHDIGKIVLSHYLKINQMPVAELANHEKVSVWESEQKQFEIDHAEVGYQLLTTWGLPEDICNIARYHHQPLLFDGDTTQVDLIHVADSLSLMLGIGIGAEGLNYKLSPEVEKRLKLNHKNTEAAASVVLCELDELRTTLA